jgi:hypothetical protein
MVSPTVMVSSASAPSVMMTATAPAHMAVTMTVATFDLNDGPIGAAQRSRGCGGHCRRRQSWSYRKSAGGKSDQQKPLHLVSPPLDSHYRDRGGSFGSSESSMALPSASDLWSFDAFSFWFDTRRKRAEARPRVRFINLRFKISRFLNQNGSKLGVASCLGELEQRRHLTHKIIPA